MADHSNRLSIKFLFVAMVLFVTLVTVGSAIAEKIFSSNEFHQLERNQKIKSVASLISREVVLLEKVYRDDIRGWPEDILSHLSEIPSILTVHVYLNPIAVNEGPLDNDSIQATYDRIGQPQIPKRTSKDLARLIQPRTFEYGTEYMHPITSETGEIGLLYIRLSDEDYQEFLSESLIRSLILATCILIFAAFLAWRFERVISEPIGELVQFLRRVARSGDYEQRAGADTTADTAELSDALNNLLKRMQGYIERNQSMEQEYQSLNAGLEEMVSQRTTALKEANQELIQTLEKLHQFQRQIVQNEKMASLGDMVAGVAHEVNTPIGLGVTASTMMLDRLKSLKDDFENKNLKASAMQKFINEGEENLNIIYRNLNRAAELISSFKQVAVDQSSETSRVFVLEQLIDEILLSLRPRLKKLKHHINVECDSELCIESKAGPINQILINLIMNSILHGFEDIEEGNITLTATISGKRNLHLVYIDDGKGIPDDLRKRIFDPFVTTKRGQGGSGLGMHLVYNLVTQALNGSITVESKPGEGVKFDIIFPVKITQANKVLTGRYE
ncbi:sensor histidine kinase [Alteromonas facilis]|uniref:sensor histidine kinase n=1 Tax=Alteromonas facilis TaxID=2048004 RepID=UPI000C294635|nr:ATP-binding protein [Alteromonas facilis]